MSKSGVQWKVIDGQLKASVDGRAVVWYPQPGAQEAFLRCPVGEVLMSGNRGSGKTDALLMSFAQHVGQGYGAAWKGILFRRTFPELSDVVTKSKYWFRQIWPGAAFNVQKMYWEWPTGEILYFSHIFSESDWARFVGHNYPFIGWEELVTWPTPTNYLAMMACLRSSVPGIPLKVRSTTNAFGPGHTWIKKRFRLPMLPNRTVGPVISDSYDSDGNKEPDRVAIRCMLAENRIMLFAQPDYALTVAASAKNPAQKAAWMYDDWTITAGGMFDDLFDPAIHVVPDIPYEVLKKSGWRLNRAYDHGQSRPFAVGWWAESNGNAIRIDGRDIGIKKGDLILFDEWYGFTGEDNEGLRLPSPEIALGIIARERDMGLYGRIKRGPADSQIFARYEGNKSVASEMASYGVYFDAVDKSSGSRRQGWEAIRTLLKGAIPAAGLRESPGLFVCERCEQFRRTVPVLSRSEKDLDDVDPKAEDHMGDMTRYRVRATKKPMLLRNW